MQSETTPQILGTTRNVFLHGVGRFGFALLKELGDASPTDWRIQAWDEDEELRRCLRWERRHSRLHPGCRIDESVGFAESIDDVAHADVLILTVPSIATRSVARALAPRLKSAVTVVSTTCAIDGRTGQTLSQVIAEELGDKMRGIAVLAGGMLAQDLVRPEPFSATLAVDDPEIARSLMPLFASEKIVLESQGSAVSTEFASAVTQVLAMLAGFAHGSGFGPAAQARLVTRAATELQAIGVADFGARTESFSMASAAWGVPLWIIASGFGADRELGLLLGRGYPPSEALIAMNEAKRSCEGIQTLKGLARGAKFVDYELLSRFFDFILETISVSDLREEFLRIR